MPLVVLALTLSAAAYGHSRSVDVDRFVGLYTLQNTENAQDRIDRGIEDVTNQMNYFKRGFARSKIRDNVYPEHRIELAALPGDRLRIAFDDWRPPPLLVGGDPVATTAPNGQPTQVSAFVEDDGLVIEGHTAQGVRRSTFILSNGGRELTLSVSITSDQLPAAIAYQNVYRRAG